MVRLGPSRGWSSRATPAGLQADVRRRTVQRACARLLQVRLDWDAHDAALPVGLDLRPLGRLPLLQDVSVQSWKDSGDGDTAMLLEDGEGARASSGLHHLTAAVLPCRGDAGAMVTLLSSRAASLASLELSEVRAVAHASSLQPLSRLSLLQDLALEHGTGFAGGCLLAGLSACAALRELSLRNCTLSRNEVQDIGQLTQLTVVYLVYCRGIPPYPWDAKEILQRPGLTAYVEFDDPSSSDSSSSEEEGEDAAEVCCVCTGTRPGVTSAICAGSMRATCALGAGYAGAWAGLVHG